MNIEWKESPSIGGQHYGYAIGDRVAMVQRSGDGTYRFTLWLETVATDGTEAELGAHFEHSDLIGGQAVAEEALDWLIKATKETAQ